MAIRRRYSDGCGGASADLSRDYLHSTFADLVLSGLLGLHADDTGISIDPLQATLALGWFEVSNLRLRGHDVHASWAPESGARLSVDGVEAHSAELGRLRVATS